MEVKLYHKHYNEEHLKDVIEDMKKIGAPEICGSFDCNDVFNAYEGCHRIRAAKILGLTPILREATDDDYKRLQSECYENNGDWLEKEDFLKSVGDYYKSEFIEFEE